MVHPSFTTAGARRHPLRQLPGLKSPVAAGALVTAVAPEPQRWREKRSSAHCHCQQLVVVIFTEQQAGVAALEAVNAEVPPECHAQAQVRCAAVIAIAASQTMKARQQPSRRAMGY